MSGAREDPGDQLPHRRLVVDDQHAFETMSAFQLRGNTHNVRIGSAGQRLSAEQALIS